MITKLAFPLEALQLNILYQDKFELDKAKASSINPAALSKVHAAYHELYFPAAPSDRPYIFASMVLSLDGKMAFPDDPQGPVVASANAIDREGGLIDFWILNILRAHADAIIVGAKTLQMEPDSIFYCLDPDLTRERKENLGKDREYPYNFVISLDGQDVPLEHSIFATQEVQTIIATCHRGGDYLTQQSCENLLLAGPFNSYADVDGSSLQQQIAEGLQNGKKIVFMSGEDEPNIKVFLYALRKIGIQHLLVESPTYMWLLMKQQVLDEFFMNYSSLYIGGPITPGHSNGFSSLDHPHSKFLVIASHQNSFLFTRQKLVYGLSAL